MLSLRSISKTYVTKAKTETKALKDVNIEIADSGMVFILGKSGSGKSTLLNLLGGLDVPTDGEIFVDGASMQQFSPSDYANYRNNYVGFIFQEFNLLADFNVRDNVSIALKLTKAENVDEKVSDALKRVELNDGYLTRRIDEMSGGEKQRIAIARALIKDSRLILADEPTGNLDSATGESIWNILKNLSRERLVVVVSHDRESAEKYADRIIEIADGQVVSDNGVQQEVKEFKEPKPATKSRLSFANRLKMGYNNLKLRKFKTASVILVAILSILSLLITQICLSYSPEVALAEYIEKHNVKYFTVSQGQMLGNRFTGYGASSILKNSTKKYIEDNCRYIGGGVVGCKQDILDFGLSFVGEAAELEDNSFYTTTEVLENVYERGSWQVKIDGNYVTVIKEFHPTEFLIGKTVKGGELTEDCVLAGVIDSGSLVSEHVLPEYFYNKNFDGFIRIYQMQFNLSRETEVVLGSGDKQFDEKIRFYDYAHCTLVPGGSAVLTADGLYEDRKLKLEDNEIVLPYGIYARLFDAQSKWYYIGRDFETVLNIPEGIGQTFTFGLYEYGTGELYAEYKDVKLAGVYFSEDSSFDMPTGYGLLRQIERDFSSRSILIQTSSVKNLKSFITTLRRDYLGSIFEVGTLVPTDRALAGQDELYPAKIAYLLEEEINYFSFIFFGMGAILLIILILLVINLISFSITSRKKEIGILSAIGASNKDITGIFLIETVIIATIAFLIDFALSFIFAAVFNVMFSKAEYMPILMPFLRVDILTVAILIVASFGLLLLAALIPIRKIIKLKPIDAIRNV